MVIAHRLHTIVHADRIHVVDNGAIVESGRHDELLRRGGRYAQLYHTQFKDWVAKPEVSVPDQFQRRLGILS